MSIRSLLYTGFLISIIESAHFNGGSVTFRPLNSSATGSTVSILITQTYIWTYPIIYCDNSIIASQTFVNLSSTYPGYSLTCISSCTTAIGYSPLSVYSPCTDFSDPLELTIGQRSDVVALQSTDHFTIAFQNDAWYHLALPATPVNPSWSLACTIKLLVRPDGTINTSPEAVMVSPINIPVGTTQYVVIPVSDADNDNVRCRFANGSNECGDVCPPGSLPSSTTILSNCTLVIKGLTANVYYAVTIQVC
ncbi:unnamed protein product [Didymodactylos carnosus]|uniref:Uncharacterized protein n=1 Tax=Didymodactylos carnosus TaxID=1234261 RepID=A0A8S2TVJ1_9BILA|nr:unnamed protein product [Didymodactylos carnosus]CAF4284483.1 unnamed protein product [Didymodactylos carnosus]